MFKKDGAGGFSREYGVCEHVLEHNHEIERLESEYAELRAMNQTLLKNYPKCGSCLVRKSYQKASMRKYLFLHLQEKQIFQQIAGQ